MCSSDLITKENVYTAEMRQSTNGFSPRHIKTANVLTRLIACIFSLLNSLIYCFFVISFCRIYEKSGLSFL